MENIFLGVVDDIRSVFHKQHDYKHEERVSPAAIVPIYGTKLSSSPYFAENQYSTSSCIPHGVTLARDIEDQNTNKSPIRTSKMYLYRQRSNYPSPGMFLQEALQLVKGQGTCLYATLPTPTTESEANYVEITQAQKSEALSYKGNEYYRLSVPNSIDTLATIASQGHGIPIVIYATYREWGQLYPDTKDNVTPSNAPVRHCVCVLPYGGFIENGKKYITIQDSAWFGGLTIRHLSEDFISSRVYDAGYINGVVLAPAKGNKPVYTFLNPIKYGDISHDVLMLQKCLVYEGLLPDDCTSGNFYGRTLAAVKAFQLKYRSEILDPIGLTIPTGNVGNMTLKKLNALYSK